MKKLLLIIFVAFLGCKKNDTVTPTPNVTSTLHTFELRWISLSSATQRTYTYPNNNLLSTKTDTSYQGNSIVTYQYEAGSPNKYTHSAQGYSYSSTDSIEVQIWIDGIMKVKKKDEIFVSLNYLF